MEYFLELSQSVGLSRVYTHLSAISFHYRKFGKTSPCDEVRVKMFMRGLKRKDSKQPVRRAMPLTLEILEKALDYLETDDSLTAWRTVWRMIVSFSCFLRYDDLRRLTVRSKLPISISSLYILYSYYLRLKIWNCVKMKEKAFISSISEAVKPTKKIIFLRV